MTRSLNLLENLKFKEMANGSLKKSFFPIVWLRSVAYLRHFPNEQEVNFLIAFLESTPVFQISRFFFPKGAEKQNLP